MPMIGHYFPGFPDSVQTAFYEGHDECLVHVKARSRVGPTGLDDGMQFTEPSVNFQFQQSFPGRCRTCEGFGKMLGIDEDLVIPDQIAFGIWRCNCTAHGVRKPWVNEAKPLLKNGIKFNFPIHRPYNELTKRTGTAFGTATTTSTALRVALNTSKQRPKIQVQGYAFALPRKNNVSWLSWNQACGMLGTWRLADTSITDLVLMPIEDVADVLQRFETSWSTTTALFRRENS